MAKKSSIEKNNRRRRMSKKFSGRRARLKAIVDDRSKPVEERFAATLKTPRRCLTRRPRRCSRETHSLGSAPTRR